MTVAMVVYWHIMIIHVCSDVSVYNSNNEHNNAAFAIASSNVDWCVEVLGNDVAQWNATEEGTK